ncbi:ANTAR domain-containing protein [Streptomyces sp. Je 1-369]|uniref:ANTAR domain-containing protein n=1 Tax=Streptomyces sp. Je 1-369 TaxID=2966192 RepID=UPI002285B27A|nr:ANTAR domain-containing protein [Streptomyces sp. Je 1-369]WAL99602.1 ANTAR domain-containing protein [Streptomyces sp. Je 1-369]
MPEPAFTRQPFEGGSGEHSQGSRIPTASSPRDGNAIGGRRDLVVRGELDLDTGQRLRIDLYRALTDTAAGVDLDLREVDFCDCSGLNLLLSLRQHAVQQGKTVVISHSSPVVDRLLELTGTRSLFVPPEPKPEPEETPCPVVHEASRPEGSEQDLHVVVAQLRRAMKTRPTIDLARGILMSTFNLSPEAAWDVLVTASQNTNTKLHVLAGDVVGTVQGTALPDEVRKQLDAAITKAGDAHAARPAHAASRTESLSDLAVSAVDPSPPADGVP